MRFNMSGRLIAYAYYNPKQLGEPEVIREINPTVLFAFLQPFEGYLRSRGLVVKRRVESTTLPSRSWSIF